VKFYLFIILAVLGFAQESLAASDLSKESRSLSEQLKNVFGNSEVVITNHDEHLKSVTVDSSHFFFVTHDGKYLFSNSILDTQRKVNLIDEKQASYRQVVISKQAKNLFVNYPSLDVAKHEITVFTDIDCPYCRQFHNTMGDLNRSGITVNYVMLPRAGIDSASYAKTLRALCTKDPAQSITLAMQGKLTSTDKCDSKQLDQQLALAKQLKINATPTLVLPNGELQLGAPSVEKLMNLLSGL